PADRFATAGAFAEELRRWLNDEPLTVWPPTWWEKARRWGRRNLVAARVAVAAAGGLGVGGTGAGVAPYKWILESETRAEVESRALLDQALQRTRSPAQGRRLGAQEILKRLSEPWQKLPEKVRQELKLEARSVYAATLGVPDLAVKETDI